MHTWNKMADYHVHTEYCKIAIHTWNILEDYHTQTHNMLADNHKHTGYCKITINILNIVRLAYTRGIHWKITIHTLDIDINTLANNHTYTSGLPYMHPVR